VNTLDLFLKVLGGIGGIVLFFIGYCRYSKSQTWKKNEFVANEIKDFNSNTMVRNTMYMLDWNKRFIELFPDKPEYNERFVRVTRATLRSALLTHKIKANFKKEEVAIRDHFDCFLDYFEKFQQFIEAGLISKDELRPYLKYWIKRIGDDMESDVKNTIHHYINEYGYNGVQELFSEFGQDIIPKTRVESCLVREEELMETDNIEFESTI
jgi:transketolase